MRSIRSRNRVKHCLNDGPPSFWYFSSGDDVLRLAEIFLMKALDAWRAINRYILAMV